MGEAVFKVLNHIFDFLSPLAESSSNWEDLKKKHYTIYLAFS